MEQVKQRLRELIQALKNTEAYREFRHYKRVLDEDPSLAARVDAYRTDCFRMQQNSQDLLTDGENLRKAYADLWNNPITVRFLSAENTLCRYIRDISLTLSEQISVELPKGLEEDGK